MSMIHFIKQKNSNILLYTLAMHPLNEKNKKKNKVNKLRVKMSNFFHYVIGFYIAFLTILCELKFIL